MRTIQAPERTDLACNLVIDQSLLPVFQQDWWLEVARGKENYNEARALNDGVVVGRLPYVIRRTKIGTRWGAAPAWSNLGGPVLSRSLSEREKLDVLGLLLAQLPTNVSYGFVCSGQADDANLIRRAFAQAGFSHFTETTYCQDPGQADVLRRLKRKHRLHLEAARKTLDVVELDEDEFIGFYSTNLVKTAATARLPLDIARALIAAGRTREQIRVFGAVRKAAGSPLDAAIACAWDKRRYYYWMSTRRNHESHPDAIKLLILNAMSHAQSLGLVFDTDGCSTPGSLTLYKDLLRIPKVEVRDVFERTTKLQRWCLSLQERLGPVRYLKRRLKLAPSVWVPGRPPPGVL